MTGFGRLITREAARAPPQWQQVGLPPPACGSKAASTMPNARTPCPPVGCSTMWTTSCSSAASETATRRRGAARRPPPPSPSNRCWTPKSSRRCGGTSAARQSWSGCAAGQCQTIGNAKDLQMSCALQCRRCTTRRSRLTPPSSSSICSQGGPEAVTPGEITLQRWPLPHRRRGCRTSFSRQRGCCRWALGGVGGRGGAHHQRSCRRMQGGEETPTRLVVLTAAPKRAVHRRQPGCHSKDPQKVLEGVRAQPPAAIGGRFPHA